MVILEFIFKILGFLCKVKNYKALFSYFIHRKV